MEIYDRWAFDHNVPEEEKHKYRDNLKIASKFHDIGKVGISDLVLKKPAKFDNTERAIMQGHTCIGAQLFEPPESDLDKMSRDVALYHHERWDGGASGYPGKCDFMSFKIGDPVVVTKPLVGEEIPLAARIVAVADVFDALSHRRCYKEAWTLDDSFAEIQVSSGTQFDPEVVLAFMKVRERIMKILLDFEDSD